MIRAFTAAVVACLLPLASSGKPPAPTAPESTVVVGFQARRVDAELVEMLAEQWARSLPAELKVVHAQTLGKVATSVKACSDEACIATQLRSTGAALAVSGEVSRLGGTYFLKVALVDVATGKVEMTVERQCGAQESELVKALDDAGRQLFRLGKAPTSDAPRKSEVSVRPGPVAGATAELNHVRVPNKNRQRALYACLGGAMATTAGVLLVGTGAVADDSAGQAVALTAVGTGIAAFVIGGIVYVVSPEYHTKAVAPTITAAPIVDGKQAGVAVAGRF